MRALAALLAIAACSDPPAKPDAGDDAAPGPVTTLSLEMRRVPQAGLDPFEVVVTVTVDGVPTSGKAPAFAIPKGAASAVTDRGDGTYAVTVTPATTGIYPVTVTVEGATITRRAIVFDTVGAGVGQPMAVPGDFVNTPGYEDGITVTPDGQYLFVQYGPLYFSGIVNAPTICADAGYSIYNLNDCAGKTNAGLVFDTIGPSTAPARPGFHAQAIVGGKLRHLPGFVIAGVANGLAAWPTVLYGFHRQPDGTFAEPFRVAFDDPKGINGPFGLSFVLGPNNTATFALAWNNFLDNLGDDDADIYAGTLTLGQDKSLGTVTYGTAFGGDSFGAITPTITAVPFASNAGQQGNPHLGTDASGAIKTIWTDDETSTRDLSVYRLTAGTFPGGTWVKDALPAPINTADEEDQPFFTGAELVFSRGASIVSHAYRPANGTCANGFTSPTCWGAEEVLIGGAGHTGAGELFGAGEPTIATIGGKRYLYFAVVEVRDVQAFPGIVDFNLDAGFVEIP